MNLICRVVKKIMAKAMRLLYKEQWKKDYYSGLVYFAFSGHYRTDYKVVFNKTLMTERADLLYNGLSKLFLNIDFRLSNIFLGAEPEDYFFYEFYKKDWRERNLSVTRYRLNFLKQYVNMSSSQKYLDDKVLFAKKWGGFFNRKWCDFQRCSKGDFVKTFIDCDRLIVKDLTGRSGVGIEAFPVNDNLEEIYEIIKSTGKDKIVEEYFYQKGMLHEFNPTSLNTLRVSTVRKKDDIEILFAFLRVGRIGSIVDNFHSGGVAYSIDIESGILQEGTIMNGKTFERHPGTNKQVKGKIVPNWNKVCSFCKKAHKLAPKELNWIGWDICVSAEDIFLIEGNSGPLFSKPVNKQDDQWGRVRVFLSEYDVVTACEK